MMMMVIFIMEANGVAIFFWYGTMSEQVVSGKGNFWGVTSEDVQTMNKGNPIIFKLFV